MIIISHVAADFTNSEGGKFRISAAERNLLLDAPAWIKDTLNFKALAEDGSIETAETKAQKLKAENYPTSGITAEGKKEPKLQAEAKAPAKGKASEKKSAASESKADEPKADEPKA